MVYLMVEQQFAKYPWCQRTIRGIFEEVRKRRIHVQEVSELPGGAEERSCVLLVGASEEWINQTARGAVWGFIPLSCPTGRPIPPGSVSAR